MGGRFMQSVSSTLNNDFYRCPCRRRAAMPSGQVYELFYHSSTSSSSYDASTVARLSDCCRKVMQAH